MKSKVLVVTGVVPKSWCIRDLLFFLAFVLDLSTLRNLVWMLYVQFLWIGYRFLVNIYMVFEYIHIVLYCQYTTNTGYSFGLNIIFLWNYTCYNFCELDTSCLYAIQLGLRLLPVLAAAEGRGSSSCSLLAVCWLLAAPTAAVTAFCCCGLAAATLDVAAFTAACSNKQ